MHKLLVILSVVLAGCASPIQGPTADQAVAASAGASAGVSYSAPVSSVGSASASNAEELVLSREVLVPAKTTAPSYVGLRKIVTVQTVSQPVEIKVEGYEIVRSAPTTQVPDFTPKAIGVDLLREVPVAQVKAEVVEVIRLKKTVSTQVVPVSAEVRSESVTAPVASRP